jgi:hypothetical protein
VKDEIGGGTMLDNITGTWWFNTIGLVLFIFAIGVPLKYLIFGYTEVEYVTEIEVLVERKVGVANAS